MPIDLIIFDCDGVLVDSEVISCRAHANVLSRHGYPITPYNRATFYGGEEAGYTDYPVYDEMAPA